MVPSSLGWMLHIAAKELTPIIIAAVVWGKTWKGKNIRARCDNTAVVTIINSCYSKDPTLMQMLRCLFFIEAYYQFTLSATHLPGMSNDLADNLSRNRLQSFLHKMGGQQTTQTIIPDSLLQWLLHQHMDWTSQTWMQQFGSSVTRA